MPSQSPVLVQIRGSAAYRAVLDDAVAKVPGVASRHDLARLALREFLSRLGLDLPEPMGPMGRPFKDRAG